MSPPNSFHRTSPGLVLSPFFLHFESTSSTIRRTNVLSRCEWLLSRTTTLHKRSALSLLLWGTNLFASLFSACAAFLPFFQCFPFYDAHVKARATPAAEGSTGVLWEDGGRTTGRHGDGGRGWVFFFYKRYRVLMSNT